MEREAVRQGDGFLLEVARCAHGLLLPTADAQSTSPNTQTARPSGTSRTGAATPSAATTKIIPAAILVTRPIGMSLLRTELSNPPQGIHHVAGPTQHACDPYTELETSRGEASRGSVDDACRGQSMLELFKRVLRWVVALIVILIGVFVLLPESRWLRKKYAALKQRYPKVFSPIEARRVRARHDRRRARRES